MDPNGFEDYVVGAEILAASLAATGTTRPLVALVTDGLSSSGLRALRRAGWLLLEVGLMGHEGRGRTRMLKDALERHCNGTLFIYEGCYWSLYHAPNSLLLPKL